MNIWILNHYADAPDRQSTRSYDLGRQLVRRGHRVSILASGFSHYTFREDRLRPQERWKEENWNGVRFFWLRTFPYRENNWRRVLNMASYAWRAFCLGRKLPDPPDAIVGVSVHPLAALCGWVLSVFRNCRFYFEVTDLWPEVLVDFGMLSQRSPLTWLLRRLEKFLYRRADRIIMIWPRTEAYVGRYGIPARKIVWIPHVADLDRYRDLKPYDGTIGDEFTVMYLGSFNRSTATEVIPAAAKLLADRGCQRVRFLLAGGGACQEQLLQLSAQLKLCNIEFLGLIPKRDIAQVMSRADAFVVTMKQVPLLRYGISLNKVCDYLASGRPTILAGEPGYDPVHEARAGLSVPAENPVALADAIERLMARSAGERVQMGKNGLDYLGRVHSLEVLAERLEQTLSTSERESGAGSTLASNSARESIFSIKRAFDVILSGVGLVIVSPLFALLAALIVLDSPGPVFYRGVRVGRGGKAFRIFKFRTMIPNADQVGGASTPDDDSRVTRVGRFLRKHKLDELPQLLNVLKGEMSLVGPRPQVPWAVARYTAQEKTLLRIRPGITDSASLQFRDEGEILRGSADPDKAYFEKIHPEKMRLSLEYARRQSLWSDCKILARTVAAMTSGPPSPRLNVKRKGNPPASVSQ